MSRVLAIDYGKVRVGLAVSDPLGQTAQPLRVVERPAKGSLVDMLCAVVREVEASEIVMGLPLQMDGSEGPNAQATRAFARALQERSGVPVVFWDERLTTVQAERDMRTAGVTAREQRGVVDKVAAAVLLRSYLDSKRPPTEFADVPMPDDARRGKGRRR